MPREFEGLSTQDLMAAFEGPPPEGDNYAAYYYTEIAHELGTRGTGDVQGFLSEKLLEENIPKVRGAIFGLARLSGAKSWLPEKIVGFLEDSRPDVVAESIWALSHLRFRLALQQIQSFCEHDSPLVVGAALHILARQYPKEAVSILLDALENSHHIVRETACDELDDLGIIDAIPSLKKLLNDPHEDVRQAATTALENLSSR